MTPDSRKALAVLKVLGIDPFLPGREHEQLRMAHNAIYLLQELGVDCGYDFRSVI